MGRTDQLETKTLIKCIYRNKKLRTETLVNLSDECEESS